MISYHTMFLIIVCWGALMIMFGCAPSVPPLMPLKSQVHVQ